MTDMDGKKTQYMQDEPIAVIGMSCIFPQAPDVKTFWRNILNGVNAIGDPLPEWEADRYLEKGRVSTAKGGYLRDLYRFNPREFGIMPGSIDGGEPDQLLALQVAKRALEDAGAQYLTDGFDHRDTGIILGHSTHFHRGQINSAQHNIGIDQTMEILQAVLPAMTADQYDKIAAILKAQLPQFNADMASLEVPNAMTGRIANRLNFSGPNYLIDAACASSLLAVNAAVEELRAGRSRMMLAGGVNASLPAEVTVMFTLLDALSKRGRVSSFDVESDGTLLGEGLGVVVLKRLSDAKADGDRIYALVRGVGQSSDGKGLGLLAPSEKGETLAMRRAYDAAGIDPATVELIEAHGTGIPLGDKTEIAALRNIFGERQGAQGSIAVGSVKSMISHCIPAAGVASFIKTCCALYHKTLPPMLCNRVNPALGIEKTPFYVNNEARPWIAASGFPRRAGVNSFGFGGVNAHAILEEAPAGEKPPEKLSPFAAELCVFSAATAEQLQEKLATAQAFLSHRDDAALCDIAHTLWRKAQGDPGPYRLAMVAQSPADLAAKIAQAQEKLEKDPQKPLLGRGAVMFSATPLEGKLAFLFPGEGSQYIGMLADLAVHFDAVREWFDVWRGIFEAKPGESRTDIVFPPATELTEERRAALDKKLHDMDVGSEAVFIAGLAMNALLESLGVAPDVMLGHSSGESAALAASRAVPWERPADIAPLVRRLNGLYRDLDKEGGIETGALMAIALIGRDEIEKAAAGTAIMIGMENCPTQTIVYGSRDEVARLSETLTEKGAICEILPFDRGYHTPAFEPMKKVFEQYYKDIDLGVPRLPLYSCATAAPFPADKKSVRALAAAQWVQKVRFIDAVNALYDDGVRHFVEVGPGGKLASFTDQILRARGNAKESIVTAGNLEGRPGLAQLLHLMGRLYVNAKAVPEGLFAGRALKWLDLSALEKPKPQGMFLYNTMPRLRATPELKDALRAVSAPLPPHETAGVVMVQGMQDVTSFTPFITQINTLEQTAFAGAVRLNVEEDEFLRHHILSGRPSDSDPLLPGLACVPLMVTLEIMAEAAAILAGRIDVGAIEEIETYDWIALDEGECILDVTATMQEDGRIRTEVTRDGGRVMSAYFLFGPQPVKLREDLPPLGELAPSTWPEEYEVYHKGMFHGPIFQLHPTYRWNDSGIDSDIAPLDLSGFFRPGDRPQMVLNPVLFDAHNQLTAFWAVEKVGSDFNSFPARVGRMELYGRCPQATDGLSLRARRSPDGAGAPDQNENPLWDFECRDENGAVVLRMGNMKSVYFAVPNAFYRCRHDPLNGWAGYPYEGGSGGLDWHLTWFPEEFCAVSKGIFLRILAHTILNRAEREEWNALTSSTPPEKARWLFPRFAAKEAVRYWLYQETGHLLCPADIDIWYDAQGAVRAGGWWCEGESAFCAPPAVHLHEGGRESFVSVLKEEKARMLAAE